MCQLGTENAGCFFFLSQLVISFIRKFQDLAFFSFFFFTRTQKSTLNTTETLNNYDVKSQRLGVK